MGRIERTHYCSYCLHFLDEIDDFCPHTPCGRTRPATGWAFFYESGENIDGRFRIRRRLGAGGAGVTYRAIDLVADDPELRDVAIKILHHDRGQGILKDRLRLEGEVLRRLDHPNVVPFRELKVDGAEPYYLATGYVPGGSLDDLLRAQTKLSARSVLVVGSQIARSLAAAHAIGVIHRDLKPANILVRDLNEYPPVIRVADWGIARAFPEFIPRRHVTIQGGFVGTPEFASPEQLRGEPTVGPPTDVFGLGVLLHTLAGGQPIRDLVSRGVVDFNKLREGASRYERVPLSLTRQGEAHMPLLDELLDQLITRSPEARPDAETVAAYCEELIEAGDTTPQHPVDSSALPALTPVAAFEPSKEDLFLPADGGRAKPLQLSNDGPPPPRAPDTVEFEGPAEVLASPPLGTGGGESVAGADDTPISAPGGGAASVGATPPARGDIPPAAVTPERPDSPSLPERGEPVEVPWPRADEGALAAPTAVPEDAQSLPAVEVLQSGAPATQPVLLSEPSPASTRAPTAMEPSPINERDDEPIPRRRMGLLWGGLVALLMIALCAGIAALALGPATVARFASLGPLGDSAAGRGESDRFSPDGRRQGLPDPPRSERSTSSVPADDDIAPPVEAGTAPVETPTGGGEVHRPEVVEAPAAAETAGAGEAVGPAEEEEPPPSEGIVIDHGIDPGGGRGTVGHTGDSGGIWATRPGAPSAWPKDYRLHRDRDGGRRSTAPRGRRGERREGKGGGQRPDRDSGRSGDLESESGDIEDAGSGKLGGRDQEGAPDVEGGADPEGTAGAGGKFGSEPEAGAETDGRPTETETETETDGRPTESETDGRPTGTESEGEFEPETETST